MQIDASVSEGLVMPVGISSPGVSLPMDLITERRQGSGLPFCGMHVQIMEGGLCMDILCTCSVGMQVPVAITVLRNMSQYLPNSFRNQTLVTECDWLGNTIYLSHGNR